MELDDAYANAAHIPNAADYPPRWAEQAGAFRQAQARQDAAVLGLAYGESPRQKLDLFYPQGRDAVGICVFVHGGYWLRFDRSYWSHLAAGPLGHGWAVAMPSYDLCPDVRIADITRQIARATEVLADTVPGPIALAGHSAGGHLVGRMAVAGVLPNPVAERLQSVVPISPVADLRPMLRTSMNAQFGLDMNDAEAESPVLMRPMADLRCTVWVGEQERPAFLAQARQLSSAWTCPLHEAPDKHHFNVIDALCDPGSTMVADLCGSD